MSAPPQRKQSAPPTRDAKTFRSKFGVHVLLCNQENLPAFKERAEMDAYFNKYCFNMDRKKEWLCDYCYCWHRVHYPLEISGQSSGKTSRKDSAR